MTSTKANKSDRISPTLLTERRKDLRLSQSELARRAGVDRSLICHIEAGRRPITDEMEQKISDVFWSREKQIEVARRAVVAAMDKPELADMRRMHRAKLAGVE